MIIIILHYHEVGEMVRLADGVAGSLSRPQRGHCMLNHDIRLINRE